MVDAPIINGHCVVQYGLDKEGLALIADEAVSAYRSFAKDQDSDHAHNKAIQRTVSTVQSELDKLGKSDLEKVWDKYIAAQDVIERLEHKIEFGQ
jgi:hypothetical protein